MPISLFGYREKTPAFVVRSLCDSLALLDRSEPKTDRTKHEVSRRLSRLRVTIARNDVKESDVLVFEGLACEIVSSGLIPLLFSQLTNLQLEARKDAMLIFSNLIRRQSMATYLEDHSEHLLGLFHSYGHEESCTYAQGVILRECLRFESLAQLVLYSEELYLLFGVVQSNVFLVSSDGFLTLTEALTRHKTLVSNFLSSNFERFFMEYTALLVSPNYVTCRQSLKLLSTLLLDRHNVRIMLRYVESAENLKVVMDLLKSNSNQIRFEAFHVFKVFVANPEKPRPVRDILLRNRDKLLKFFNDFLPDRESDSQFSDEKAYIVKLIHQLH